MKGDFSRQTFNHSKHYSGVLMQQGRVQLDADGNEAQAILRYRDQTEATDVIGVSGAPEHLAGFEITAQDSTLTIGAGRYYVDGILCENDIPIPYTQQPDLPNPPDPVALLQGETNPFGLVYLDVWQRHITALDDASIREPALGSDGPDTTTRIKNVWQVKVLPLAVDLTPLIDTLKNVQGELQNIAQKTTNSAAQKAAVGAAKTIADFLASPTNDFQSLDKVIALYGNVIAQLLLARSQILGVTAGPPDFADWQALEQPILELEGSFLEFEANLPTQDFAEWDGLINVPTRTLKARTQPTGGQDDPCLIPPSAGYQLLENQLYRVEILQGGDPSKDTVSFVWSRDNGTVVTAITTSVNAGDTTVTVDSLGPDNELGFAKTQTVEILDDSRELYGLPGQLAIIADINPATRVVTLDRALNPLSVQLHAKMRRWDGEGLVTLPATADDWIALEGGIQVQFAAGTYRTGDYWLIPARVGGGIQWPTSPGDGSAIAQSPLGIQHHYSRLALILLEQESVLSSSPPLLFIARHPIVRNLISPVSAALSARPSTLLNRLLTTIDASIAGELNQAGPVPFAGSSSTSSELQVWDCRTLFPAIATTPSAMHVIQINWQNDWFLNGDQFLFDGLVIVLDKPPDPDSVVDGATMIVTLGLLSRQLGVLGYTPIDLLGTVQVVSNVIWWRYVETSAINAALRTFAELRAGAFVEQLRVHVTLKGHAIWQAGTWLPGTRPYLDGQALGVPGAQEIAENRIRSGGGPPTRRVIDLVLPSGSGVRASDFESWFFLPFSQMVGPFQVSTVNFLSITNETPEPAPIYSIAVPPIPAATDPKVQFKVTDQINAIDVVFNRAVSADGFRADDLEKGLSVDLTIDAVTTVLVGTLTVKADGATVRFTDVGQQPLPAGSYQVILTSVGAAGPLVKAESDGVNLDGDFDNQPGGNFVFPFTISVPIG